MKFITSIYQLLISYIYTILLVKLNSIRIEPTCTILLFTDDATTVVESTVAPSQNPTETTATGMTGVTAATTKAPTEPAADVDITHPEVKAFVDAAVKEAENQTYTLAPEAYVEVLEEAIQEVHKELKKKGQNGPKYVSILLSAA